MQAVTVLGAGAFGQALALTFARAGQRVTVWGRDPLKIASLPHHRLSDLLGEKGSEILWTSDLSAALATPELLVFALPAQAFRTFFESFKPHVPLLIACKGLETTTGLLLSEVADALDFLHPFGFLAGPHLATEIKQGFGTAGILASQDRAWGQAIAQLLGHSSFRLTHTPDIVGAQVVGALKNVMAIAGGVVLGAGGGENARAAVLTQGLQDMRQFGEALGCNPATLWTQAGIGDFMLTCLSAQSRNTRFGIAWGRGENPDPHHPLAEGFFTTSAVLKRARMMGIRLPIVEALGTLLSESWKESCKESCPGSSSPLHLLMECLS